jgi:aminoglycoside 2''-phosphotransferase
VKIEAVRAALTSLSAPPGESMPAALADASIEEVLGGWSFFTFRVGSPGADEWIFRFPRNDAVGRGLEKELRLLPELAGHLSQAAVPVPVAIGRHEGLPFAGYRALPGRPLSSRDVVAEAAPSPEHAGERRASVARILAELHGFPSRRAAEILQTDFGVEAWGERYAALRREAAERVEPRLDLHTRDRLAVGYARFQEEALGHFRHPVLVHCDLGVDHLLVDDDGFVSGVIDFEDAALGDPAIDFVGIRLAFGEDVTRDVLGRYGGPSDPGFESRLRFYCVLGSVHAILYGLTEGNDDIVAQGIEGLRERLEG